MYIVRCAQSRTALAAPSKNSMKNWKALARGNRPSTTGSSLSRLSYVYTLDLPPSFSYAAETPLGTAS